LAADVLTAVSAEIRRQLSGLAPPANLTPIRSDNEGRLHSLAQKIPAARASRLRLPTI